MKPLKLHLDNRPLEQPESTYPFAKNGIQFDLLGSAFNEPGFRKLNNVVFPYQAMGVIETDTMPVIFSTNNTNSAIGFFDPVNEVYTPIIDDRTWGILNADGSAALLGFNINNYITGQSQRDYIGDLLVVFTDKTLIPFYLNTTNPNIKSLDDLRLFASFVTPNITITAATGGSVASGAYYIGIGYERNDGTSSQYSAVSSVTIIPQGTVAGQSNGVLEMVFTNIDTSYDNIRVAIISVINGVISAVELTDYIPISGNTISFNYTGNELSSAIDVSVVTTPPAIYDQVGTIGQLNDYLYLGNLQMQPDIDDMQSFANIVQLEWVSQLISAVAPPLTHINGTIKSFKHNEAYAFYIRYYKIKGGQSKWFHMAGPSPRTQDTIPSPDASKAGFTPNTNIPKAFKVQDCIPYYDAVGLTGGFGTWQNDTETYPDTIEFDSTSIGGRNLRKQLVLHHKTPSQRWCATNLYRSNITYGQSQLDLLGVRALNVKIPAKYVNVINGYEIGYAIRTVSNMTNYGQGAVLHGTTDHSADNITSVLTTNTPIYTDGGNYCTNVVNHGAVDNNKDLGRLRTNTFRMHPFDILFNKPSIVPDFLSRQFSLYKGNLSTSTSYMEDGDVSGNNTGPLEYLIDYTNAKDTAVVTSNPFSSTRITTLINNLNHINRSFYCPTGVDTDNFINGNAEYAFCGYLDGPTWPYFATAINNAAQPSMQWDQALGNTHSSEALKYEECYIADIIAIKSDIYQTFYSQNLTSAGSYLPLTSITTLWGGDAFVSRYTFHTYGRINSIDSLNGTTTGVKIARSIVCESASNINLRFEDPSNQYTDYWPKSPLVAQNITNYLTLFLRAQEPNQFGYTKDYNALNNLIDSTTWNPFTQYTYSFPYRIHRGGLASRTGRPRSWRTFLPLDYYEMQKNMGTLVHLEGMDDRLIIHMQNAMFLTQDKTQLQSGPIAVTLGSGDIFQFPPQEVLSSKLGYAGTQHDLACVRTPFGYVFVDALQGEIYLYKGKLTLLNEGLNTLLRDVLKMPNVNIYLGNGITIGWDQKYKRILLTVKNKKLPNGQTVIPFQNTPVFWSSLQIGDIVSYKGRYVQYMGPNTTTYNCTALPIVQTITWQPQDQFCLVDANGNNTGIKGWNTRAQFINGTANGYVEPNTNNGGLGPYFPPVTDTTICSLPVPVTTWQGSNGVCLPSKTTTCPTGYTLSADGTTCSLEQSQPATPPSGNGGTAGLATRVTSVAWNNGGAQVYAPGFSPNGSGTLAASLTTPHLWVNGNAQFDISTRNLVDGRMNAGGVWVAGGTFTTPYTPVNEFIGFSRKVTVTAAQNVYIGMSADNSFKILVNGIPIVDTTTTNGNIGGGPNFNFWNVYPAALQVGDNYIEMYAENFGDVAGFAAEIYGNTLAELKAATSISQLNILFSTSSVIGQPFNLGQTEGYSCPVNWSLDPTTNTCILVTRVAPTISDTGANSGLMAFNTRCSFLSGLVTGYCEDNTSDGTGQGPYLPPVQNASCLPITPPAPGAVTITGTISITCSETDCINNGVVTVTLALSVYPKRLGILIGQIVNWGNTTPSYVGSNIMPGAVAPDGTVADPTYGSNGATLPFEVIFSGTPSDGSGKYQFSNINQQNDTTGGIVVWVCQPCNLPITDLYVKLDSTQQDSTDTNTYTLDLTSTNGYTIHNE